VKIDLKHVLMTAENFSVLGSERLLTEFEQQLYEMACRFSHSVLKLNNIQMEKQIRDAEAADNEDREIESSGGGAEPTDQPSA